MRLVLGRRNITKLIRICFLKGIIPYCCSCITCNTPHGSGKAAARYSYRTSAEEQSVSVLRRAVPLCRWQVWCRRDCPGFTHAANLAEERGGQCSVPQELMAALVIHNSYSQINLIMGSPISTPPLKGTRRNIIYVAYFWVLVHLHWWAGMTVTAVWETGGTNVPGDCFV